MHWPVDSSQLPQESVQYATDTSHGARPWPKHSQHPGQWSGPQDPARRRRTLAHGGPLLGRRTAPSRHWDDPEYHAPDPERRWVNREYPRRWGLDPTAADHTDHCMATDGVSVPRRQWGGYPSQYQTDPGHLSRHRISRRDMADATEDPSRWPVDPMQLPRRRVRTSSHLQYPWTNDDTRVNDDLRYDDDPHLNRRWASIQQRRLTTVPPVLTRPNTEGSFPRTRRWKADPTCVTRESEAAQPPVNFIMPPQTVGFASVPPQQPIDYGSVFYHPTMDFGAARSQPPMDFAASRTQPPLDFGASLPQPPLDFAASRTQPPLDFGASFPQQPLEFGTMSPHQMFGWCPAHPQLDFTALMNPLTMNYRSPAADFGAMPTMSGMERTGVSSAPPTFGLWSSEMSHFYPQNA